MYAPPAVELPKTTQMVGMHALLRSVSPRNVAPPGTKIFDWFGRLYLFDIQKDPYEKNNLAKQLPDRTNDLFEKLMNWTKDNVKETYIPYLNKDYDAQKEERNVPFVNLVEAWNKGENIAEMAN